MKIQITIDCDIADDELKSRSPLMKILRVLGRNEDKQVQWYMENRDRILKEDKERRSLYAKKKYREMKAAKAKTEGEAQGNVVVLPVAPVDNILMFD